MLQRSRELRELRARDPQPQPDDALRSLFAPLISAADLVDARFISARGAVVGASGLAKRAPLVAALLGNPDIYRFLAPHWQAERSILVRRATAGAAQVHIADGRGGLHEIAPPGDLSDSIAGLFDSSENWGGMLDENGCHVFDPRSPAPGPHFFTNLLLGHRVGLPHPLQTTAKSVVDQLGRGSFRSHAATQVLASRWDLLPEENGFPANRQFYLLEDGRQVFYSADAQDNVASVQTVHAANHTTISYRTFCGLEIDRTIFLLPGEEALPLATEVHSIVITNHSPGERRLRIVVTGMFGPAAPNALFEDVVYTNVSMQARLFRGAKGDIVALSPHYHPLWTKGDERFHATIVHQNGSVEFPQEFGTSFNEFVGRGTIEHPEGLLALSNRLSRKGPGFFALGAELRVPPSASSRIDNFTCLVSEKAHLEARRPAEELMLEQIPELIARFSHEDAAAGALAANIDFVDRFRDHLRVRSGDVAFDATANRNLPFQILYQTFVSRSFDQTQKGYREIGFREVQDLFAALPFFVAMGQQRFAAELLVEWAAQVYDFGYANHNFYWTGKEPGDFSDDPLWLAQAVDSYVNLTSDYAFLDRQCSVAGTAGQRRTVYATLKAILRYCSQISIGPHGLPLLDRADWNDTLRLDPDYLNGPQKEAAYRKQLASGGREGEPLATDNCESVMNAFLLKIALHAMRRFALHRRETAYGDELAARGDRLAQLIQESSWKGDFFARVLINRSGKYRYLGAKGDGLSADPALDGCYFLNSFNWSVLAGVASESQIRTMLATIKRALQTPHGLKLCSPVKFSEITSRGGSAEYFPGDRENGGVFKHANMMAAVALMKAAKEVESADLAREMRDLAYWVIDLVMPHRAVQDPYLLAGNPRFCTQYNNSETGENVGPTLSGTAPWLWLALRSAWGIEMTYQGIKLDPIPRDGQRTMEIDLNTGRARYHIVVEKPDGFYRRRDAKLALTVDGAGLPDNIIPHFDDGRRHEVRVTFGEELAA